MQRTHGKATRKSKCKNKRKRHSRKNWAWVYCIGSKQWSTLKWFKTKLSINISTNLLGNSSLFDSNDYAVLSLNSYNGGSSSDSLHRIFDLQQVPVGTEYGNGTIVRHCNSVSIWLLLSNYMLFVQLILFKPRFQCWCKAGGWCDLNPCNGDTKIFYRTGSLGFAVTFGCLSNPTEKLGKLVSWFTRLKRRMKRSWNRGDKKDAIFRGENVRAPK